MSCPSHDQNLGGSSTNFEQLTDIVAVDQASKAESLGILEHSPHDEIEGEIVYLQSRLLNDVVAMNQRYGKATFFFFDVTLIVLFTEVSNHFGCLPCYIYFQMYQPIGLECAKLTE